MHLVNNIVAASHNPEKAAKEHQAAEKIILPAIMLNNATLEEVAEFLRLRSREIDPAREGVNINLFGDEEFPGTIVPNLDLKYVPFPTALKYVCDLSNTRLIQQGRDFSIFPKNE